MAPVRPSGALCFGLLLLAACTPPPDPPPPLPPPPSTDLALAIGTGAGDGSPGFVDLVDESELVLEPGSQGGFHVFVNVRLDATVGQAVGSFPLIKRNARRVSTGQLVSRAEHKLKFVAEPDGHWVSENSMRLFLCPTPVDIPVADELLELEVIVTGEDGTTASGKIRFLPRCPSGDQNAFCARICYG